ncbi:MAG: restriction endonuclease subunit S [Paludibacteraceae bacterium]|nr:restriction endonuclease subunit S [Paludibacteraceae bacterium]
MKTHITRYSSYKDSGIQWLGEIPSHWRLRKMKYTFCERSQKGFPNEPLLAATQNYGVIKKSDYENRTVEATKNLDTLKLVEKGDFVISLRSFQGGIEYSYCRGIISPAYTVLKAYHLTEPYFKHLAKSPVFINLLKSTVTGIREGQNIDYNKLKVEFLPIPTPSEQQAIASYLDSVTAKIDKAIAQQQKMIDLLNERKQIIINNAVTKGLNPNAPMKDSGIQWFGEIPSHWEVLPLGKFCKFNKGLQITKDNLIDDGLSVVSYGQVHAKYNTRTHLSSDLIRFVPYFYKNGNCNSKVEIGDFIVADTSEDIEGCGNMAFNDCIKELYGGYHTILIKNIHIQNKKYLAYLFNSTQWRSQVRGSVCGVKVFSISKEILKHTVFFKPPIQEQNAIVLYLDSVTAKIDKAIAQQQRMIDLLKERKQIIINSVVTGKVKVC